MNATTPAAPISDKSPDARDRILAAAQKLFAMRGFEGVSTTEIAREAGITQPLIHYHFKNKDALWKATAARLFGRLQEDFQSKMSRTSSKDTRRYLAELIYQYVHFAAQQPDFARFILQEGGQVSDRLDWLTEHWMKPAVSEFRRVYDQAQAEGLIRQVPMPEFMTLVAATANQYFSLVPMMKSLFGFDPQAPDTQALQCEQLTRTLLTTLMVEPEKALAW